MLIDITNRKCTINDAVGTDQNGIFEDVFLSKTEPTAFVITRLANNGGLPGYQANYVGSDPPLFWRAPINFVCRGSTPPTLPAGSTPLPPWQPAQGGSVMPAERPAYCDEIGKLQLRLDAHPSFYHLDGEVVINGVAEAVTMYFLPAGTFNDKDFVLIVVCADQAGGALRESGIGHGNF